MPQPGLYLQRYYTTFIGDIVLYHKRKRLQMRQPISEAHLINCMKFMEPLPDNTFSIGIPDPPYGLGETLKRVKGRENLAKSPVAHEFSWDSAPPPDSYFSELKRVTVNQIIWGANYFPAICGSPFKAPRRMAYGEFMEKNPKGWIIWDKVKTGDFSDCELAWTSFDVPTQIFYFMWNGMCQGVSYKDGKTMQGNKKLNERRIHPTQKPLPLYQWELETFTKPGDSLYDSHMGSQNSRIAAYKLGLDYYGNEISPQHYTDGCKRFQQLTYEPLFNP